LLPQAGLQPRELGVIVNDSDPLSRQITAYYREQRGIPEENIIHVKFSSKQMTLKAYTFKDIYERVTAETPPHVQAYALTWSKPYKAGCMSITTAFATGYDTSYCPNKLPDLPCGTTKKSPYFSSFSRKPATDYKLRPTMMLAATNFDDAKQLIDRGIKADGSFPKGKAYLLETSDKKRSVRADSFPVTLETLAPLIPIEVLEQDFIRDKSDVLFYFTGKKKVPFLDTLEFPPGAVADHLTSGGGHIKPKGWPGQMSSLRWLEAGATGSYGTVFEPCNIPAKFPNPGVMMSFYLRGESLIESYWKSVAWPAEGLFIGEPLSTPFALNRIEYEGTSVNLPSHRLWPESYQLQVAESPIGPYHSTGRRLIIKKATGEERLDALSENYYRLVPNSSSQ
jgi:uncharacterized protein (TIGR03790 family)